MNKKTNTAMKKFLILAMAALTLSLSAQAQTYRNSKYYNSKTDRLDYSSRSGSSLYGSGDIYYGLRIGPSFSTVNSDDQYLDGGSSQTGLEIGVVMGYPLSNYTPLYLESGLFYIEKGGKGKYNNKKMTYDLNYLEIPIVVKYVYDVDGSFSIQPFAGGYLACGVGGKMKNFGDREAFSSFSDDAFQRFDAGLKIGCGVGYDMFYADLSYEFGLTNISHDYFDESHNGCFSINFGVNF